ncbi:MAG: hypothetical protein CUN55_09955 [Phototrophicales bacterium]|nr:MAG: hypothetical protein CUN55_09955 [Phototrophicales bacterium]
MDNQKPVPNPEEQGNEEQPSRSEDMMQTSASASPVPESSDDPMKTVIDVSPSSATPEPSTPKSPPYDPYATQYVAAGDEQAVSYDPYATQFEAISEEQKTEAIAQASEQQKRKTQEKPPVPSEKQEGERRFPPLSFDIPSASIVSQLGLVPLWGIYALIALLTSLGLAWFMRFLGILLLYGDISIMRTLLGVVGGGLAVGALAALKYVPQLAGLQERTDTLDKELPPSLVNTSVPKVSFDFWFLLFAGIFILSSFLIAALSTEQHPIVIFSGDDKERIENLQEDMESTYDSRAYHDLTPVTGEMKLFGDEVTIEYKNMFNVSRFLFGIAGAAILVGLLAYSFRKPLSEVSSKRDMSPIQIGLALASGIGLIMLVWSTKLINHQSGDFVYFFLLAFVGVFGMGGTHLTLFPLRFIKSVNQLQLAFYVAILTILLMSVVTIFLDASSVEGVDLNELRAAAEQTQSGLPDDNEQARFDGSFDYTWRFSYSPAYFVYMLTERGFFKTVVISILLVFFGILGMFFTFQGFGYHWVENRTEGRNVVAIATSMLFLLVVPMIALMAILRVLSMSRIIEGTLLWLVPFLLLLGDVWIIHNRTSTVDRALNWVKNLAARVKVPALVFLTKPINQLASVRGEDLKAFLSWPTGIALAVGLSIIAAPFTLSFWFYLLLLVGALFLLNSSRSQPKQPVSPTTTPSSSASEPESQE